jgi:drug/metabolite transporter (DMT)-like permease
MYNSIRAYFNFRKEKKMGNIISPEERYRLKKVGMTKFGLFLAWLASITLLTYQNFNAAATANIYPAFGDSLLASFIICILCIALCEFTGGILLTMFNSTKGIPLVEYARLLKVKSTRTVLISAIAAGPIGTACAIIAVGFCGSTYTNSIISLTPVVIAIAGRIFLKENTNSRVYIGILIAIAGCIIASFAAPEGVTNFYLGLAIALVAPFAYATEAMISTHAMDVSDPLEVCSFYRMIGSSIIQSIIVVVLCAITGHLDWIGQILGMITASPIVMFFLFMTAVSFAVDYSTNYVAMNYAGAVRCAAVLYTTPIWSIPVGYIFAALGILPYAVTTQGIIGAIIVVIGVTLVLAKPSELFNLRKID